MASLRKAKIVSDSECRIRIKETGEHKIVRMLPLKTRIVKHIDNDGDPYEIEEQDYIVIDNDKVVGFLINPARSVMNDVHKDI